MANLEGMIFEYVHKRRLDSNGEAELKHRYPPDLRAQRSSQRAVMLLSLLTRFFVLLFILQIRVTLVIQINAQLSFLA